ncbi:DUF1329 domain-containing protein [Kistimonas asteriae]|uniref:DUF1329 domain-containing protein n=1 Tax=Kistimonas asteriae TaxID=517724 RepID=UPI001BAC206D|nr:DUF1329 domain-containing protein [Kistimonas asteriae]
MMLDKTRKTMCKLSALSLMLLAVNGHAKVSEQEAQKLGTELTWMGAEKSANADGSIPAWEGGFEPDDKSDSLDNPFAEDAILFTIDQSNIEQYRDKLSPGQQALIAKYPNFKINVYPTRRSAAYPQSIYEATRENATQVELNDKSSGLKGGYVEGVPFPVPQSAEEVLWNHITRYRGGMIDRVVHRMAPQANGEYVASKIWQTMVFNSNIKNASSDENMLFYFLGETLSPARNAGTMTLVHETLDQLVEPRKSWIYNVGQRRVRRAPQVAYDSPQNNADGQATSDNMDMYNGSPDRYEWKLVGKKEIYIPYNNYQLHDKSLGYDEIVQPGHLNSDLVRYELHRVWEVEGVLKDGVRHSYKKRTFFIDEDTWQIAVADHYDNRDELWRIAQAYHINFHNDSVPWYTAEAVYDLTSNRYLVSGLSNEVKSEFKFGGEMNKREFKPSSLRRKAGKN